MSKRAAIRVVMVVALLSGMVFGSPLLAQEDAGEWVSLAELRGLGGTETAPVPAVEATFGQMPLYFIENQGQVDGPVAYYVQGKDKMLYFTPEGITFVLSGEESERWVLRLDFLGANRDVQPVGQDETSAVISYFKGRPEEWKAGLRTYSKVVYPNLWPGIDLEYLGTVNQLKYQFVVHPGADSSQIRLAYRGADVSLNEVDQLEVATPAGGFRDGVPYAHQVINGEKREIAVSYELAGTPRSGQAPSDSSEAFGDPLVYGFHVGEYDRTRTLVLDPAVLVYCGYIGGAGTDWAWDVAVDREGNAYVIGETASAESRFPVSVGPDLTHNGDSDVFVAKVNADGMGLVYCGYIGGSGAESGRGIDVDADGSAYVTGYTGSSQGQGFPVSVGPDLTHNGGQDAFVAKLRADGTALDYCGYIGGSSADFGYAAVVDRFGRAFVTGYTSSSQARGFPLNVGPDLTYNGGGHDGFVARVRADGTELEYCGYIGGSGGDRGLGIALDSDGYAYVSGDTWSDHTSFPVTVGPDTTFNGYSDAFVAKVMADGAGLVYCGYIGGERAEALNGVTVDSGGSAYVVGSTKSSEALGFPVLVGPDLTHGGGMQGVDGFVAKVTSDGTALVYCGYIGGAGDDWAHDIDLDSEGTPYVVGATDSSESQGFPVVIGPDRTYNGGRDAYVAKVSATGKRLLYCGYVGGAGAEGDGGTGIAVDAEGSAYLTGNTTSAEATFPVTVGPDLDYNGGDRDAFVAKVSVVNHEPTAGTVVPASGSGSAGVATAFITSWSDADAWEDLKQCYFHIGHGQSLKNEVVLLYHAQSDKLYMRSDDGKDWLGGFAPGSANILENSQAQVDCSLTIAQGSADTLVVAWAITFKPAFAGTQKTYLMSADISGARSAKVKTGTWTIQ